MNGTLSENQTHSWRFACLTSLPNDFMDVREQAKSNDQKVDIMKYVDINLLFWYLCIDLCAIIYCTPNILPVNIILNIYRKNALQMISLQKSITNNFTIGMNWIDLYMWLFTVIQLYYLYIWS